MKIILATHQFPPHYAAGAELYALRVARWLQGRGHAVEVVCVESITNGSAKPTCESGIFQGLLVHRLHFDLSQAPDAFRWTFRNPEIGGWLESFLCNAQPDLMHINSCHLLSAIVPDVAHKMGIPAVLTMHDYWFLCPLINLLRRDGSICGDPVEPMRCVWCLLSAKRRYRIPDKALRGRLGGAITQIARSKSLAKALGLTAWTAAVEERRSFLKQTVELVNVVVCPSQFLIDKLAVYGLQPRRVVYLPFGIEVATPLSNRSNENGWKLRIGYLGQIAPHKGIHTLLKAFKKLRTEPGKCELIIYGNIARDSSYGQSLLRIADNDSSIRFFGPYPNSEVGRVLNNIDLVVVPSECYENRPTVIVEALAYRTPVVASDLGGMAELVDHGVNGLLFRPGDVTDLARQLQSLVDKPGLLSEFKANIAPVESVDQEMWEILGIYSSVLSH